MTDETHQHDHPDLYCPRCVKWGEERARNMLTSRVAAAVESERERIAAAMFTRAGASPSEFADYWMREFAEFAGLTPSPLRTTEEES